MKKFFFHWKQKYHELPKLLRFMLFWGTWPIWAPLVVVVVVLAWIILAPIDWVIEAYDRYDYN